MDGGPAGAAVGGGERAAVLVESVDPFAEAESEGGAAAETVVEDGWGVGGANEFERAGEDVGTGAGGVVVGDFLVPRDEVPAVAERAAAADGPVVVVWPVFGTACDVEDHVVDETLHVEEGRGGGVRGAVRVEALDEPVAGVGGEG